MLKALTILFPVFVATSALAVCPIDQVIQPFKADLEKQFFNGREVSFRLLVNGPQITDGKYFFVADDARWSGPVKIDLQNCKMETDGNWIMWRTIDAAGQY